MSNKPSFFGFFRFCLGRSDRRGRRSRRLRRRGGGGRRTRRKRDSARFRSKRVVQREQRSSSVL